MYFRSGDSLAANDIALLRPGLRGQPVVQADAAAFNLDTVACYVDTEGRHVLITDRQPYLQIVYGRIDVYRRFSLRPNETVPPVSGARLNPFDLLQQLPDERLYRLSPKSLIRLTAGNTAAQDFARSYRYNHTRAAIAAAVGGSLAAAGAITAIIGAFMSDADADYRRPYYIAGAAGAAAGTALLTIPLPYFSMRTRNARNAALNRYNAE